MCWSVPGTVSGSWRDFQTVIHEFWCICIEVNWLSISMSFQLANGRSVSTHHCPHPVTLFSSCCFDSLRLLILSRCWWSHTRWHCCRVVLVQQHVYRSQLSLDGLNSCSQSWRTCWCNVLASLSDVSFDYCSTRMSGCQRAGGHDEWVHVLCATQLFFIASGGLPTLQTCSIVPSEQLFATLIGQQPLKIDGL